MYILLYAYSSQFIFESDGFLIIALRDIKMQAFLISERQIMNKPAAAWVDGLLLI